MTQQPVSAISPELEAPQLLTSPQIPGLPRAQGGEERFVAPFIAEHAVVANIGQATAQHLRYAVDFHQAIPPGLQVASRDPLGAGAMVCAFLLASEPSTRQKQLEDIATATTGTMRDEIVRISPQIQGMPPQAKIPLLDLALPSLRRLSPQQFEQFRAATEKLVESNPETDLFLYMVRKIVVRHLERHFFPEQRPITQFYALRPLAPACGALLSATAYAGQENITEAYAAFAQGAICLNRIAHSEIPWLPPDQCDLSHVDAALAHLSQAVPQIKKNVLSACAKTVAADGVIQEGEAELLRAIADALDCPVPPFVQSQEIDAPAVAEA